MWIFLQRRSGGSLNPRDRVVFRPDIALQTFQETLLQSRLSTMALDMNNAYIANIPMQDVRRNYPDYVMGMLQDFVHKSRRAASNKNIFDARVGYEPQTDVTPQEYRQRCTRAQCGLQCSARKLWENYSASVFTNSPSFQELRGWQGGHLDGASQEVFINELLTAVGCLLCNTCTPGIEFYKVEKASP